MKLFYDARYIRPDFHDGISRYTTELGNALAAITPLTFIISSYDQLTLLPQGCDFVKIHHPISVKEPFTSLILNKYHPDVVFTPLHTLGSIGRRFKLLVTSHDMIYLHHHTPPLDIHNLLVRLGWRLYYSTKAPQRFVLNRADIVVTVSDSAKKEFQDAHLTKRPILVIKNAPDQLEHLLDKAPDFAKKAPRNIVYMGAFIGYKNVEVLVRGMEWLDGYTLHLLSRVPPFRKVELSKLIPKDAKVIFHNGVSDVKYAKLLADNAVLASGSLDEGFGLPVAETLKLGVPAVITDMPVFHEVAGDGALYFDPHSPHDFADQIKRLDDDDLRVQLVKAGKKHVEQFSWDVSAAKLLKAITDLLK